MDTSIVEEHSSDFKNEKGTLLVVDGHSLAFRAFFAVSADNFSTRYGQATNSVWGFITMLSQVVRKENPDRLAIAFDVELYLVQSFELSLKANAFIRLL